LKYENRGNIFFIMNKRSFFNTFLGRRKSDKVTRFLLAADFLFNVFLITLIIQNCQSPMEDASSYRPSADVPRITVNPLSIEAHEDAVLTGRVVGMEAGGIPRLKVKMDAGPKISYSMAQIRIDEVTGEFSIPVHAEAISADGEAPVTVSAPGYLPGKATIKYMAGNGQPGIMVRDALNNVLNNKTLTVSPEDTESKAVKARIIGAPEVYIWLKWTITPLTVAALSADVATETPVPLNMPPHIIPVSTGTATVTVINCNQVGELYGEGGDFTASFTVQVEMSVSAFSVSGTIDLAPNEDPAAGFLTAAQVRLMNGADEVAVTSPNTNGGYTFDDLAAGAYTIEVSLDGYITGTISGFSVSSGNVTEKDLELAAAPRIFRVTIDPLIPGYDDPGLDTNEEGETILNGKGGINIHGGSYDFDATVEGYNYPPNSVPQDVTWEIINLDPPGSQQIWGIDANTGEFTIEMYSYGDPLKEFTVRATSTADGGVSGTLPVLVGLTDN
jgi:hypothetical protein